MQTLPAKDQAVFRSIVKFYETKQYKKGVKAADSILKKHPDHGETLCMKGLTLSYLDKKEEAYELVRKGLKHDLRSHVCWHVYGLLYRQDRDYFEAVKCYRNALRIDPENMQILRDLSLLQIHRRDVTGFAETRRKLLQLKPSNRLNWVGYAVAEHLCKSFEFAWTSIDNYEKSFKDESEAAEKYEKSELFLYKCTIMEEAGKFHEALECLKQHDRDIVDKIGLLEMKGRLCMFLGRYEEAAESYRRLIKINIENHVYVLAYMANLTKFHRFWPPLPAPRAPERLEDQTDGERAQPALPATVSSFSANVHPEGMPIWGWLPPKHAAQSRRRVVIGRREHKRRMETYEPMVPPTEEEEEEICKLFDELQSEFPRSDSLRRLPLYFLSGPRFLRRLDEYLRKQIRKGVPSLFRLVRSLYFQPGKPEQVEDLLLSYSKHLSEEIPWFGPLVGETAETSGEKVEEPPSCLLFTWLVAADHYDFVGETDKALEYADKAIAHTPTFVEIYMCKARIYKHAGDNASSAEMAEEVRSMDLADRFLNCQCVRALLRVDDVQTGMEKALLFSKDPDSAESANLHDMQCMWYESAVGRSYTRKKNYGKALKMFHETFKHFNDINEDQFDFHNYCLRKVTLRAYVGMLRMQERLYSHKFYRRAAKDAIRIYLELYDRKLRGEEPAGLKEDAESKEAEMSKEDKKKMKHKLKREQKKVEDEKAAQVEKAGDSSKKPKKVDDDPNGEKLLKKDVMEEANKLVKNLMLYCGMDAATHALTYDVLSRQGKWLHCLHAVTRLYELGGQDVLHYKLIAPLAHFCFKADLESDSLHSAVREVILSEMATVLGADKPFENLAAMRKAAASVVDRVERRLKDQADLGLVEVLYGLRCLRNAGRDCGPFLQEWWPQSAFSLKDCRKVLAYLAEEYGADSKHKERFQKRCLEVFPLMNV